MAKRPERPGAPSGSGKERGSPDARRRTARSPTPGSGPGGETQASSAAAPRPRRGPKRSSDDPRGRSIAAGLGQPLEALARRVAGDEAGDDAGEVFYVLGLAGLDLAVREDALTAYLAHVSPQVGTGRQLAEALAPCGLVDLRLPKLRKVKKAGTEQSAKGPRDPGQTWIKIAEGRPPVAAQPERVEYLDPAQPGETVSAENLRAVSAELRDLLQADSMNEAELPSVRALAAVPGAVIARILPPDQGQPGQDVFGREVPVPPPGEQAVAASGLVPLTVGPHVTLSPAGEYRAERLGYVSLPDNTLSVVSPLWLDPDRLYAYWLVLGEMYPPITADMVHQCLADQGVVEGVAEQRIARLLTHVGAGSHAPGSFLIAAGTPPEQGEDARVEMLVDVAPQAGRERADGSIDFREVNFAPNVAAGQRVARRTPPTRGTAGTDVTGRPAPAHDGQDEPLVAGENVRVERGDGIEHFFATVDGALRRTDGVLSVAELLTIQGDVSFATGNLRFDGQIHISGSVGQGFAVEADGDITVGESVEPGARVSSQADVTVGQGILGQQTRVMARGTVRAQFVQEASLQAGQDIALGNYAYHADLRAGRRIVVAPGSGPRGGSLMGGHAWARQGIEAHTLGAPAGTRTTVVAGVEPDQPQQLDKLQHSLDRGREHILRILRQFGLSRVDLTQIRNRIRASVGSHRKLLARQAQQLGQLVQAYQQLQQKHQQLQRHVGTAAREAEIKAGKVAFPGTVVCLGEHQRELTEEVAAPRFHLENGHLAER